MNALCTSRNACVSCWRCSPLGWLTGDKGLPLCSWTTKLEVMDVKMLYVKLEKLHVIVGSSLHLDEGPVNLGAWLLPSWIEIGGYGWNNLCTNRKSTRELLEVISTWMSNRFMLMIVEEWADPHSQDHMNTHTQKKKKRQKRALQLLCCCGCVFGCKIQGFPTRFKAFEVLKQINFLFVCTWFSPVAARPPEVNSPCMSISMWALHSMQHLIRRI